MGSDTTLSAREERARSLATANLHKDWDELRPVERDEMMVTVHTDEGRHRLPPEQAARVLVDTYGTLHLATTSPVLRFRSPLAENVDRGRALGGRSK